MVTAEIMRRTLYKTVLGLYLLMLTWVILFKFSLDLSWVLEAQRRSLSLTPFTDLSGGHLREMFENLAIFVPFGLLLSVNFKQTTFWRKLSCVFLFSLAAETVQFVFAIGAADITDVITNTLGGFVGLAFYSLRSSRVHSEKLDLRIAAASMAVLVALVSISFSHRVVFQRPGFAEAARLQSNIARGAKLAWPASGQAAIGSVEDGLLARSSDHEKSRPTASMAKVITALAILEKQPLKPGHTGPSYVINAEDVANYQSYVARGGSVLPVYEGMELTQYQALQAMLLPSANNIADMLAVKTFGSIEAYTAYAQNMLQRMGLSQTVAADASGFSANTVSTPSELVMIGIVALKNPVIAEIVAQPQAWIPGAGPVKNTNELLGVDGVVGIKTGTTDQAGNCLLFAAHYNAKDGQRKTIVGVVMGDKSAPQLFSDSKKLLASVKQALGAAEGQPASSAAQPTSTGSGRAPR